MSRYYSDHEYATQSDAEPVGWITFDSTEVSVDPHLSESSQEAATAREYAEDEVGNTVTPSDALGQGGYPLIVATPQRRV